MAKFKIDPKGTLGKIVIALGVLIGVVLLIMIISAITRKKEPRPNVLEIDPEGSLISIDDNLIEVLVDRLEETIDAGFFVSVNFASIYNEVNMKSDYDVIRIANRYNAKFGKNLPEEIDNELYWSGSSDQIAAGLLYDRLKSLGF